MKFLSISFAALLQAVVLPAVISAAITEIPVRAAETVIFQGRELHIATVPITPSSAAGVPLISKARPTESSLTKRDLYNACFNGGVTTCTDGLSNSPDAPDAMDCTQLAAAVKTLAESHVTGIYPCHYYTSASCPSFTVPAQYERTYTIGTCQVAFANLRPLGGDGVQYCDYLIAGSMPDIFARCVTERGFTGGYSMSGEASSRFYALIVRHS